MWNRLKANNPTLMKRGGLMNNSILKAEKLSKVYKDIPVVDQIDLEISAGRLYGLIGKNGAGKTTFIRMVAGLTRPTSGKLALYGEEDLISGIYNVRR